jgi:hypothetical protein
MRRPASEEHLVHPFLALPAATIGWWLGRVGLHAGSFATRSGCFALVGTKGSGKTSTLAALHQCGVDVLSDDLVMIDGDQVLPGPSCLDLRRATAERLGLGEALGVVGQRERWRLRTRPTAPIQAPLRGFIVPQWGDCVEMRPIPLERRLELLYENLAIRIEPRRPTAMLDLLRLEFWSLVRPRDLSSLGEVTDLLVRRVG